MMRISDAVDLYVDGTKAVKVVEEDPNRFAVNLFAGIEDLWWGGTKNVKAGTIANKVRAGGSLEVKTGAEIWVIRAAGAAADFSFSEEFK